MLCGEETSGSVSSVDAAGKAHLKAAWRIRKMRQSVRRCFGEYARLRKWIVGLLGASILIIGAAMVFLPGPAIVVIPAGLAILASEFAWARKLLRRVKKQFDGRSAESNRARRQQ